MRKQKKLLSLLLAGLLALNTVGCSAVTDSETKDSDTSAKSSEKKDDGEKKKKAKEKQVVISCQIHLLKNLKYHMEIAKLLHFLLMKQKSRQRLS